MRKRRNDLIARLERLSKKVDISVLELAEMASKIVSVQIDPIEATGEPFVFQNRRPNCEACLFDPLWINTEVPSPDADVDLIDAFAEFKKDCLHAEEFLQARPGIDQLLLVYRNGRDWCRFWSVRHPLRETRKMFVERLAERETAMEELRELARGQLARRANG
jgi:hypothetical protein